MGYLADSRTEQRRLLYPRTLVGRSPLAQLRLTDRRVSSEHAVLWFDGEGWKLRDLGSRNGTWVAGERVAAQQTVALKVGDAVAFGEASAAWTLVDASPPGAVARCVATGQVVTASQDLLLLPDAEMPRLAAYPDGTGAWLIEVGEAVQTASEITDVVVDGEVWTLVLPFETARTWGRDAALVAPATQRLIFHVSADEEHVVIEVIGEGKVQRLEPRTHAYFLLILARQRLADAAEGLPAAEQGWLHADDVCRMLRFDRATLNQRVFRARQQLGSSGLVTAARVLERRPHTAQMRLGISDVEERPLA